MEAPPVPQRSFPECPPPAEVVRRRMNYVLTCVAFGGASVVSLFQMGAPELAFLMLVLFCFGVGWQILTKNKPVARCPFCERAIERYDKTGTVPVRCPHCSEYSLFVSGSTRPVDPHGSFSIAQEPFYRSPVFENAVWPNGCVLCGAPPVRFDAVGDQSSQFGMPATAALAGLPPLVTAHVSGIPYCQHHRNAVQLVARDLSSSFLWKYFMGPKEKRTLRRSAYLAWRSLPMMRRYLAANRSASSL